MRTASIRTRCLAAGFAATAVASCKTVLAQVEQQPVGLPAVLPEVSVSATRVEQESREDNQRVNLPEALNRVPGVSASLSF